MFIYKGFNNWPPNHPNHLTTPSTWLHRLPQFYTVYWSLVEFCNSFIRPILHSNTKQTNNTYYKYTVPGVFQEFDWTPGTFSRMNRFSAFCDSTSLHGWPHIPGSSTMQKIFWALIIVLMTLLAICLCSRFLTKKITGETPEVRSDKRKLRMLIRHRTS